MQQKKVSTNVSHSSHIQRYRSFFDSFGFHSFIEALRGYNSKSSAPRWRRNFCVTALYFHYVFLSFGVDALSLSRFSFFMLFFDAFFLCLTLLWIHTFDGAFRFDRIVVSLVFSRPRVYHSLAFTHQSHSNLDRHLFSNHICSTRWNK